jgi:flagellar protein FlbD
MIKLTKINGTECFLNHTLIEIIEESPDTCITMSNGNRYLVLDSGQQIQEKIIAFNVEVLQRAGNAEQINMTVKI